MLPISFTDVDMTWATTKVYSSFIIDNDYRGYQEKQNKDLHSKDRIEKGNQKLQDQLAHEAGNVEDEDGHSKVDLEV